VLQQVATDNGQRMVNTLGWDMAGGGTLNAYATGKAGGISSMVWWIMGIASFCLCLVVLVAVVVLVIVLVRHSKKKVETPTPAPE
jgi:heme/copper-type cytochrome/quinol oxidase subunit 2